MFLEDEEDILLFYNTRNYSICLTLENKKEVLNATRKRIDAITKKYKFIVLDPKEQFTNVNVLDIDL